MGAKLILLFQKKPFWQGFGSPFHGGIPPGGEYMGYQLAGLGAVLPHPSWGLAGAGHIKAIANTLLHWQTV